jgi:hypothetical protein
LNRKHEDKSVAITKKELGYHPSFSTFFPFPRTNVGQVWTREVNGIECTYFCAMGVPHTTLDRRWFEIGTTLARYNIDKDGKVNPRIELGAITDTLRRFGMESNGGKTGYVQPARKSMERFARLHVSSTRRPEAKGLSGHQGMDFSVSLKHQILWARGRTDLVEPELFDGENWIDLSPSFMSFAKSAVPHVQKDFMAIRSPLTLDLYQWLAGKLYALKGEFRMSWPAMYAQFGQGGRLNDSQMKDMRRKIKTSLLEIKQDYYPAAQMDIRETGVYLRPSDPVVEPGSRRAGYTLSWD